MFPHRLPDFLRVQPAAGEADLVRWFWGSEWSFAGDSASEQVVVPFSTCNLIIEPNGASVTGPTTRASRRELRGTGWVMAAMLQPAAAFALVGSPADFCNQAVRVSADDLIAAVASTIAEEAIFSVRFEKARSVVSTWLHKQIPEIGEAGRSANRLVATVDAREDLNTVGDVASAASLSLRTAQRIAREYVGVSLGGMIRRRRAQVAFQSIREQPERPIAQVAAGVGYSDQAHLAGETRRLLGSTTSSYRKSSIEA
jgi:AraC-like DNA-binding protein